MLIDDSQKQLLLMAAQKSMDAGKTPGGIGITYLDYTTILYAIERGQLKYASMWLAYREEQAKMEAMQLQQQNMQMNGQNMQAQEQAKQQTLAMEMQVKQSISTTEVEGSIMKVKAQGQEDRKTLFVKALLERGLTPHPDLVDGLVISTLSEETQTPPSQPSVPEQPPLPSDQGLPPQEQMPPVAS
jgi:hypothetical protein